jgi:adenylate cyclase
MSDKSEREEKVNAIWHAHLTGDVSELPASVIARGKMLYRVLKMVPSDPRCKDCNGPFHGVGGAVLRMTGFRRSSLNPRYCNYCDELLKVHTGGAEVELAMLFADVRGSSRLAEEMSVSEFGRLINRFYKATTDVLVESDALIDKLIGDEVAALYVPGIAGPDYPRRAVTAADALLRATGHDDPGGPWIPVGVGVHVGVAYVGAVGARDGMTDITALGDAVNTAARLASHAGPGELLVSEEACEAAGINTALLESRQLELKGKTEPFPVRVMLCGPA